MWREFFSAKFSDAVFYQPVTADAIERAQSKIGLSLPQDLRELYLETNGIYFADAYMWIIWSIDDLIKENLYMHTSPENERMAE
jgi:cell wall assembly regulator SMI1